MEHLWWINPTPSTVEFGVQAVSSSLLLCMIWYIFTAPRLRLMSYLLQYKMVLKWYSIRYLFDAYYHGLRRTLSDIDAALAFLTAMPSTPNLTEGDIDRFLAHCSSQFNSMGRGHQSRLVFIPENAIHTVLDQFVKFEMPDTDNFPSFIRSEAYKYLIMAFEGNRTNYVRGTNVGYASVLSVPHPQILFTHPEVCTWAKDAINVFAIHPSKVRTSKEVLAISRMFIGIGRVVPRKNGAISQELPYWYILVKLLSAEYMATK
ncbi:hypothetical protein QCA50_013034 [Cerrena zonata]|uniref:Uncharacterized protein n=1 Tax=Cerrena zonata TaxID=2478898 RepID=A0AAW0G166_9APHY